LPEPVRADASPDERRRALRAALERLEPSLRVVAEDVLALRSRIDLVAVDGQRRIVGVVVAERGDDARALTRALAQREWLREHVPDWLKIAPELGADVAACVRAVVVASEFDPETVAAAAALPGGWLALLRSGDPGDAGDLQSHLERVDQRGGDGRARSAGATRGEAGLPAFRSGLSSQDLGLSDEEARHFE